MCTEMVRGKFLQLGQRQTLKRTLFCKLIITTLCRRVHLETHACPQLVMQFPAFYRIQMFITALTTARYLSLY